MRNYGWVCVAALLVITACDTKETVVEQDFGFDGTCTRCHGGLSSGQVHPTFKLRCIDCHGGNDQVDQVPEDAFEDEADFRDPDLIAASHVAIKADLARFFFANGLDDDGDGLIDEAPTFDNTANPTQVLDFGEIAELGLQGEGVGEFVDSELNRDLNYTRWLNPGDLRVATIGCGNRSRPALDGEAGGACHQDVVEINRRSIMVNNAAVINGAYYGNESWRDTFQNARDNPNEAADPRKGAFGYTFDFGGIDGCIDISDAGDEAGRGQAVFDSECLEGVATDNDPFAAANATGNVGLPAFEAAQGKLVGSAPGTPAEATFFYTGVGGLSRFFWGGFTVADPDAILDEIEAMPDEDLLPNVPDPIDNVLRGFRAYYPMNYPGSSNNFNFTFGTSILPEIAQFNTQNPFGRGHSSGCTSCHMKYDYDGNRRPQRVDTYDPDTGERTTELVRDPTTVHREFKAQEQDIKRIGGETLLVGVAVNRAERIRAVLGEPAVAPSQAEEEDALEEQPQQRYYSADHTIDTKITTDQCGLCHAFVTRIDFAYQGMAEDEQRDKLARIAAIEFETPAGTSVAIHDSWVRAEALDLGNLADKTVIVPQPGVDVAARARNRDLDIEEETRERCGDRGVILPGLGGCAQNVFTEDCNNNGELDNNLTLTRFGENGDELCSISINEDDLESNGVLDLISHVPRQRSVDGRQLRYVYGGANGSTRLMDIHFERGMHCIDCHMLQDSHGDGNIYATNWEQIEIECEDCHGAALSDGTLVKATLVTSGANGGNDLRNAIDHDGRPFFEDQGDRIIQRSRVTPGLFWEVPQVPDIVDPDSKFFNPVAQEAHAPQHIPVQADPLGFTQGSEFEGEPGKSEMTRASLECYTCHTSWVKNCLGCHFNQNLGDNVKKLVNPDGSIVNVAGENEVWFNNKNQAARTNFQLLSLMRSPFVLGYNAAADGHRLSWFRSSMEAHLTVFDTNGDTLLDNVTFTTFQDQDANSGRDNVATSAVAMNQHMPHTVRPTETKSCDQCHQLVDEQGRVRNDHILAETFGIGTGRYAYTGDWAIAAGQALAGDSGLELYDYKDDNELAGSLGANARFPGLIVNPTAGDRQLANVEPLFDGGQGINNAFEGTDVALIRNFNPSPAAAGQTVPPTLTDVVVETLSNGTVGRVIITKVTERGNLAAQPSIGILNRTFVLNMPDEALALAHLSPDLSDPFVYVATADAGLTVVEINNVPTAGQQTAELVETVALPSSRSATEVALGGDVAYVGTAQGTIEVFDLSDPRAPTHQVSVNVGGDAVTGISLAGFHMYISTLGGLAILNIFDPLAPVTPAGADDPLVVTGFQGFEVFVSSGHAYVAAGVNGVRDIDVTVPAAPVDRGDIVDQIAPGQNVNASDVIVSLVPVQTWLLVLETTGDLVGIKLDNTESTRERCLPVNNCGLDMNWRDPTVMGRDPSFIVSSGTFDPADTSGPPFFRMQSANLLSGTRLARPALWERIGTNTGRRLRDSFMPGSGVLSLPIMQRMYSVQVCEDPDTENVNGSGLGEIGYFIDGQDCVAISRTGPGSSNRLVCEAGPDHGSCELPAPDDEEVSLPDP